MKLTSAWQNNVFLKPLQSQVAVLFSEIDYRVLQLITAACD